LPASSMLGGRGKYTYARFCVCLSDCRGHRRVVGDEVWAARSMTNLRTTVRAAEAFLATLAAALVSQIAVAGEPINFDQPDSMSRVATAVGTAVLIAIRYTLATRNNGSY
jgi:hypothetical protein